MITTNDTLKSQAFGSDTTKLLDTDSLGNEQDRCIAILRKIQYKTTKDGRPFIRASFEDVNGYIVIGRMFDYANMSTVAATLNDMVGSLVVIDYETDYFNGSVYLSLKNIAKVTSPKAGEYSTHFVGKYNLAPQRLNDCNSLLADRTFTEDLREFRKNYCCLTELLDLSDESVSSGLRGYILDIIYRVLLVTYTASDEAILAFILAVKTWFITRRDLDSTFDENNTIFIAVMAEYMLNCKSQGMLALSEKISEFISLFTNSAHVISNDTFLIYNIYRTLVESSQIAVLESHLPAEGFCNYKSYTVRRS